MTHQSETIRQGKLSRRRTISPPMVTMLLIVLESAGILAAAFAADAVYHAAAYRIIPPGASALGFGAAFATLFAAFSLFRDDYRASLAQNRRTFQRNVVLTFSLTFAAMIFLGFLTKTSEIYSRGGVILFIPLALGLSIGVRSTVTLAIRQATRMGWLSAGRVLVVGLPDQVATLLRRSAPKRHGYDVIGVERLWLDGAGADIEAWLERIVERARWTHPDTILLALPWSDVERIDLCVRAFMNLPVRVELAPERVLDRFAEPRIARIGPILTLNVLRPPLGHTARFFKRALDLTLALVALALLSPLLLIVALMIKMDSSGPALFRQTRFGFNQKPFRIWKFRTMRAMDDGAVVKQAARDDDRITRIGRYLRRWNVDELPQLINVITGDMSLVGPRPHAVAHNQLYQGRIDLYARRHNVLPGITGWAQVHGFRGATDDDAMQKRVEYDLYYLDNWSLGLDLAIMFMTVFSRKSYRNAY